MVIAEVLYDAVEVFPVEYDLVLGQRDCQDLVAGFLPPLPAIKPGERKPIGRAVELSQDQGAVSVVGLAATRIERSRKAAGWTAGCG